MIYIGIDNGLSGGIAVLSPHGSLIAATIMPVVKTEHGFRIDAQCLPRWITEASQCPAREMVIAIEACPKHARDKAAMRSMGMSFGTIYGAIGARLPDARIIEVQSGNGRDSWQRMIGYTGGKNSVDTKPAAFAKARQLWPGETWLATARSTKPHEGLIDAALIAEWARGRNL